MKVGDKVKLRRRISQKGGKTRLATEKVTILGIYPHHVQVRNQKGVTMNRLTEWIGEGEDRHAIPRMDLRKNGHQACCNKLAEYEDLEETGMILKWILVKWHVILDAEREEEGIPDDIVYYLDCPMPEDGEEIIVTDGKRVWTDENSIDIVGHYLESGNDWKDIKAWMPLPEPYKEVEDEQSTSNR